MNDEHLQPIPTPISSNSGEICAFCLEAVLLRGGGIPLYSPGCCGKFFHQKCIIEYVNTTLHNSAAKCPSCRSSFEVPPWMRLAQNNVPNPPQAFFGAQARPTFGAPVPPFGGFRSGFGSGFGTTAFGTGTGTVNPGFSFGPPSAGFGNPFSFGPSSAASEPPAFSSDIAEDLLPEVLNTLTDVSATRAQNINDLQSLISISATPEYNVIGLGAKDLFYVRVGIHYQERLTAAASNVAPEVGNPTAGIAFTAKDAAVPTPPSTVALDIVCVLDNSGSMTGPKLTNLKSAMNFVIQSLGPNDR